MIPKESFLSQFSELSSFLAHAHWAPEYFLFFTASSQLAGVKFRDPLMAAKAFELEMYYNEYGDMLKSRSSEASGNRESQLFIEYLYGLPDRKADFKREARSKGYTSESLMTLDDWFYLNRSIDFASQHLAYGGKEIPWNIYEDVSQPKNPLSLREFRTIQAVQSAFAKIDREDPDFYKKSALLYRSLSSFGFIYSLTSIAENKMMNVANRQDQLMTLGSMVVMAQLIDDAGSPAKDVDHKILGMVSSLLSPESKATSHPLKITPQDRDQILKTAKAIFSECLDRVGLQKGTAQRDIIKLALLFVSTLSVVHDTGEYGGTYYPKGTIPLIQLEAWKKDADPEEQKMVGEILDMTLETMVELYGW